VPHDIRFRRILNAFDKVMGFDTNQQESSSFKRNDCNNEKTEEERNSSCGENHNEDEEEENHEISLEDIIIINTRHPHV
jgi:hypothetical protein